MHVTIVRRTARARAATIATAALLGVVAGCGLTGPPHERDDRLTAELEAFQRDGGERPADELFPGDWDTMHVVLGPTTAERTSRKVGAQVSIDVFSDRATLLVFMSAGEVDRTAELDMRGLPEGEYGPESVLRSTGGERPDITIGGA
ncbi:hypothetical protein HDA32_000774 [Spinactinospora alkalitolerans]|uniref:Lipoprotein n=1 Tax=Spinactinospora alkalitolerans TaxID=687207 RepID=A0A852TU52_9ACTN|nr:hypothetical protein [Spinactinospora alkalitolerans]NYE45654.1 hypothetical protein [Spinactinospora alkalitolerans]